MYWFGTLWSKFQRKFIFMLFEQINLINKSSNLNEKCCAWNGNFKECQQQCFFFNSPMLCSHPDASLYCSLKPGAEQVIEHLASQGVPLALASSSRRKNAKLKAEDPWPSDKLSLLSRAGPLAIRKVVAFVSCRTPSHQTSCRFGLVQDPKPSDNLSLLSCVGPLAIRHVVAFVLCWTPGHLPKLSFCLVQDPWPSGKFLLCGVQDPWPCAKLSLLSLVSGSSDRN